MNMRNILLMGLLFAAVGAGAQEALEDKDAAIIEDMDRNIEEMSLQRDQISGEMYKLLKSIRSQREDRLKMDKDLRQMLIEIKQKQDDLESSLKEKYPDLAELMKERDELQSEYDLIREKLFKLQVTKSEFLNKENPSGKE